MATCQNRPMPRLTDRELTDFLDEPGHLLRLATIDESGMPRISPVWFVHQDGAIVFTPRERSVFLANLKRDPRIAVAVDEDALPYRKVSAQGRAEVLFDVGNDDAWRDTYRRIAQRYIPADAAERYIQDTIDQPRALIAVPLGSADVATWRMPVEGEAGTGIWAKRYYGDGTKMANRL